MKVWNIQYFISSSKKGHVEEWLDRLDKEQFKSISKELKILEQVGNKLRLPHSRALKKWFV